MSIASKLIQTINNLLAPGSNITALEHQEVEALIVNFAASQWVTGDLKMIDCTNEYINEHFEDNGKGIIGKEREGWAICNGNNLTMNRTGRVPIAWGRVPAFDANGWNIQQLHIKLNGQPVFFGNNGEALTTNQIPTHNHVFPGDDQLSLANGLGGWSNRTTSNFSYDATSKASGSGKIYKTSDIGGGEAHNNVQPSMVTLFIQKIDE